jgi:hydrogenase nickel incorporation protein HypB
MCPTCGCGTDDHVHPVRPGHRHGNPPERTGKVLRLEVNTRAKNDRVAAATRSFFEEQGIAAFNFTSSPGAGKTSLLEALIPRLGEVGVSVIEGDQETERDAARIRATGVRVVQINTRRGGHLDAEMVAKAVRRLDPPPASLMLIENVGNLVDPALIDLGERAKVVVMSVTEGEDKPLKYPHLFRAAQVLVITKTDLLPHLDFDLGTCLANVRRVNPSLRVFQVSVRGGRGLTDFCRWIAAEVSAPEAEAG